MNSNSDPWPSVAWRVTLTAGSVVVILADSTFVVGQDRVFELLLPTTPPRTVEVARLPESAVCSVRSIPAEDMGLFPDEGVGRVGASVLG